MWEVSKEAWEILNSWNLEKNPFAAVDDYSDLKKELRWLNPGHRELWEKIIIQRLDFLRESGTNFEDFYKITSRPIVRERWEFLMARKAWYIMPLGWDNFLWGSCKILDLGCGDGDVVQRIINYIGNHFDKNSGIDNKVHLVGVDLNPSRIENANKLVTSKNKNITFEFHVGDITGKGLPYENKEFDFAVSTAVLEALEDKAFSKFMDDFCRVVKKGIYVEDLADKFPGGFPRENLNDYFQERGFQVKQNKTIFNQPFNISEILDPMNIWPIKLIRNLWIERIN